MFAQHTEFGDLHSGQWQYAVCVSVALCNQAMKLIARSPLFVELVLLVAYVDLQLAHPHHSLHNNEQSAEPCCCVLAHSHKLPWALLSSQL